VANLNKVMLIGRLTRDPESRSVGDTKVVKFGFAVNNRKKDKSGNWTDDPVFIDVEAWGRTAEACEQYLRKGSQCFLEGRLKFDQWTGKDGQRASKLYLVAENVQLLEKSDGKREAQSPAPAAEMPLAGVMGEVQSELNGAQSPASSDNNIPF
jgi:single-strand DNA-binding protein